MDDFYALLPVRSRCQEDNHPFATLLDGIEPAQGEVSRFHLGGEEKSFILFLGDKGSAVGNREGFYGGDRDIIALFLCE